MVLRLSSESGISPEWIVQRRWIGRWTHVSNAWRRETNEDEGFNGKQAAHAFVGTLILAISAGTAGSARAQYTAYDLGTLGGSNSFAYGINGAGTIVGAANLSGNQEEDAFSYSDGVINDLGTLGGGEAPPSASTPAGTIVGESTTGGGAEITLSWTAAG